VTLPGGPVMCSFLSILPFLFFLSPLNQEKFMKKNRKKRKHVYDGKIEKIHITFFF
jgi:hypothetical protein